MMTKCTSNIQRISTLGALALGLLALTSGCSTEPSSAEDPGVAAMSILGESNDNADEPELGRMRGAALGLIEGLPGVALKCDANPAVVNATICGVEQPASESYAWTDCKMGMAGHGKGKSSGGPVSSGGVEVRHQIAGSVEGCDASSPLEFTDTSDLDITRISPNGRRMALTGHISATSTHSLSATEYVKAVSVSAQRTMLDSDGTTLRSVQISGTVNQAFSVDSAGPKRIVDGTLTMDLGDGSAQSIMLAGVTRLDANVCRWPVAGTLTRVESDGTSHELVFSDSCGTATLDGATIDLNAQRGQGGHGGHGKKGQGHCMQ